jgi:hypothetical protein
MDLLMPERQGDHLSLLAWMKLPDAERKKAFEADAFAVPANARKVSPQFLDEKTGAFKIKSLIDARCFRCHAGDVEENKQFADYAAMSKFLVAPK